jgi:hypothetical protein
MTIIYIITAVCSRVFGLMNRSTIKLIVIKVWGWVQMRKFRDSPNAASTRRLHYPPVGVDKTNSHGYQQQHLNYLHHFGVFWNETGPGLTIVAFIYIRNFLSTCLFPSHATNVLISIYHDRYLIDCQF